LALASSMRRQGIDACSPSSASFVA
jgi:hypothetical protein